MKKMILILWVMLGFGSCATPKKSVPQGPKTYGADVETEFSNIENDQRRVLEYYRTLRAKNWDQYKQSDSMVDSYQRRFPKKSSGNRRYQKPHPTDVPAVVELRPRQVEEPKVQEPLPENVIEEMKIEIRQHQSYFCMKNRNSSRFSGDADCSAYSDNVYNDCEKQFPIISDRGFVNCVKKGLQ